VCAFVNVEELRISEQEKSSQAVKIQTLEGICFVFHKNIRLNCSLLLNDAVSLSILYTGSVQVLLPLKKSFCHL